MKRIFSILIVMSLLLSIVSVPSFASEVDVEEDDFDVSRYNQYTISFSENNRVRSIATTTTVDEAIAYVQSLDLSENGYDYIEESCLAELEQYKLDEVELEDYTVLIPKARAKSFYGTYSDKDFYYEYTSVANKRRETNGIAKNSSNADKWKKWILGTTDLAMSFATAKWSIPYTLIRSVTGVSSASAVYNGSRNQYVEQFTNTKTRSIYRKSGSNYKLCYQDQSSSLRVNLYFCPVGTAFDSDYIKIGTTFEGTVKANSLTKNEILKQANTYANKGSKVIYTVSSHRVKETWK